MGKEDRGQKSEVGGQRSEDKGQETEVRDQTSEVRRQRTEGRRQRTKDRRKKKGILLWERLSRPPRLSESDGGQAAAMLRLLRLLRF